MHLSQIKLRFFKSFKARQEEPQNLCQTIKLTVITQFFPPDYAPTGQLIEELARQLGNQGVDVDIFTGQPGYAFQKHSAPIAEQIDRVYIKRSHTTRIWFRRIRGKTISGVLFFLRALLHLFRTSHFSHTLLLTTAPPFLPLIGYIAHVLFGRSYLCLLYDLYPDIAIQLGVIQADCWLARLWHSVNRKIWRNAQGIIVLSSTMKKRVVECCPEIADKIYVIHNWADPEWIVPMDKQKNWFAQKHSLVNQFTVLYSGNMGRCHDIDTILAAAQQLKNEPILFVFIGAGARRADCIEQVHALGLTNFLFLPYQDKQVLPYSLTACDLALVSVSADMEGLVAPSKLYSALAAGRPIAAICQSHSYLKTLIHQANCGATFENGDNIALAKFIKLLCYDQNLAKQMGHAGRQYLRSHFTPKVISQQYFDVIRQIALTPKL